jgi:hypothetical protein
MAHGEPADSRTDVLRSGGGGSALGPSGPALASDRTAGTGAGLRARRLARDGRHCRRGRASRRRAASGRGLRAPLGKRGAELVGLPREPAVRDLFRRRPSPLSPHLGVGAVERAQLRSVLQASTRSGPLRRVSAQRKPGAGGGRVAGQADLRGACPGHGDRHRRVGRRDGPPGEASSSSTGSASIPTARSLRTTRGPG